MMTRLGLIMAIVQRIIFATQHAERIGCDDLAEMSLAIDCILHMSIVQVLRDAQFLPPLNAKRIREWILGNEGLVAKQVARIGPSPVGLVVGRRRIHGRRIHLKRLEHVGVDMSRNVNVRDLGAPRVGNSQDVNVALEQTHCCFVIVLGLVNVGPIATEVVADVDVGKKGKIFSVLHEIRRKHVYH